MTSYIASVSALLSDAQYRVDVAAQNFANMTTPGYKRHVAFSFSPAVSGAERFSADVADYKAGALRETRQASDIALDGDGFLLMRDAGGAALLTRGGSFSHGVDARLRNAEGAILQDEGGGDLIVDRRDFEVYADGVVRAGDQIIGKIALVTVDDPANLQRRGGAFLALSDQKLIDAAPHVRQGYLETSNVTSAAEMVAMMGALRQAETGQRLAHVYDDMLGRVFSSLGTSY